MNKFQLYHELMNVKGHVQTIKAKSDDLDSVDDVTAAQYGIQDIMTKIVDELLETLSCEYHIGSSDAELVQDFRTTYVSGEDKTLVWRSTYLNGECVVEELAGWHYGEPNNKSIEDFGAPTTTAYFLD